MAGPRQSQAPIVEWRPEDPSHYIRESAERLRESNYKRDHIHRKGREKDSAAKYKTLDGTTTLSKHHRHRSRSRDRTHQGRSKARSCRRSPSSSRSQNSFWPDAKRNDYSHYRSSHSNTEYSSNNADTRHKSPFTKRRRSRSLSTTREDSKRSKRRRNQDLSLEHSPSRSRPVDSSQQASGRASSKGSNRKSLFEVHSPATHRLASYRRRSRSADSFNRTKSQRNHRRPSRSPSKSYTGQGERVERYPAYSKNYLEDYPTDNPRHHKYEPAEEYDLRSRRSRYKVRSRSPRHRVSAPDYYSETIFERRSKYEGHQEIRNHNHHNRSHSSHRYPTSKYKEGGRLQRSGDQHDHQSSQFSGRGEKSDSRDKEEHADSRKMRGGPRHSRPYVDTRYSHSPSYGPINQQSPHSQSPYSGRGGWSGAHYGSHQGSPVHGYSASQSPYHQGYQPGSGAQSPYYQNQPYAGPPQPAQQGYQNQGYRPNHSNYRSNQYGGPDRRMSGPPSQSFSPTQGQRGRTGNGHFSNLSWTPATGSRGGRPPSEKSRSVSATPPGSATQAGLQSTSGQAAGFAEEEDNPFRPSKDLRVEDQIEIEEKAMPPPPSKTTTSTAESQSGSKISFALKSRAPPAAAASPNVDLIQKGKEPLIPAKVKPLAKPASITFNNKGKYDGRYDRRSDHGADRRLDHRYVDQRSNKRQNSWFEKRVDKPRLEKMIVRRPKPRPKLPPDLASSESVYHRKPGNESVVGSGTYGKVFRAVHVYTRNMVALKKIRMEGERDGVWTFF